MFPRKVFSSLSRLLSGKPTSHRTRRPGFIPQLLALEDRLAPAVITVTTLADTVAVDGAVSLREAITSANANANANADVVGVGAYGADTINFNIAGGGPFTIDVTSALPTLTDPLGVKIDGTTQTGFAGTPIVELNGAGAGSGVDGLLITSANNTVQGLVINRFVLAGIRLEGTGATNNQIQGNYIGTNVSGTVPLANFVGISLSTGPNNNLIGGTTAGTGNLISGNNTAGVALEFSATVLNRIQGNRIGTNAAGTAALANGGFGITVAQAANGTLIGGTTANAGNLISGNAQGGIRFLAGGTSNNTVAGNFIGTDVAGTIAIGNGTGDGVRISDGAGLNVIGGTTASARNVISGNAANGILIQGVGPGNEVQGNYIGTDLNGTADLGNTLDGVRIDGANNNTVGGSTAGARNVISGNTRYGVAILNGSTGTMVQGNFIGTDVNGTADLGNSLSGVQINGSNGNTVGGTTAAARNVISGNDDLGVLIENGASGNQVQGNFIGTNAAGDTALGNSSSGVLILDASTNTIGGTAAGSGNVISGNGSDGVEIQRSVSGTATSNVVAGNFIGTNALGTATVANAGNGVFISDSPGNTIGGTVATARNVISGNTQNGVSIAGAMATGNLVQGNYIGTDATGNAALANTQNGVFIDGGVNNTVGGTAAGARNVISGNGANGVSIRAGGTGNAIQGNYIGTNAAGTADLGNTQDGVHIDDANDNTVGGTAAGAGNVISGNGSDGIDIVNMTSGILVQGNYIGTNAAGTADLGNSANGVSIFKVSDNAIGGTSAAARNVISGNDQDGIVIFGTGGVATGNIVLGNYIGTDATGTADLGNTGNGVQIRGGGGNTVGGSAAGAGNVISGNDANGVTVVFAVNGHTIQGNLIGTNAAGTADLGNGFDGVFLNNASLNVIGGTAAGARNVISGNNANGIQLQGSSNDNQVQGNYVGLSADGTTDLGNSLDGVFINGAAGNTIGGTAAAARNIISGNDANGVQITGAGATGNVVLGNFIGTDTNGISDFNFGGTSDLSNQQNGVLISGGASNNTIGGTAAGSRNLISGNNDDGIEINASNGNTVQGNYVGVNVNGNLQLFNGRDPRFAGRNEVNKTEGGKRSTRFDASVEEVFRWRSR